MLKQPILSILFFFYISFLFSQGFQISWQNCYGGSEDDHVYDILQVDNYYILVGGTGSNDGDISYNHGSFDAWLVKIDTVGNILWEKTYGGSEGDAFAKIVKTEENDFYMVGASTSSDGDISFDPYPGSNDIWVVKMDSSGNILWDRIVGGELIDHLEEALLLEDEGVLIFGWTGSQSGDITVNYGFYDMWMIKLSSDGEIEWDRSYGTDDFDYGNAIIQTSDGGFLIGGASTIGNGGNLNCEPFNYNAEAILFKLDSMGNIEWQQCYGGSDHDGILSLIEIEDGYIFSAFGGSADGDLSNSGWHGMDDVWVVKIDLTGNVIWQKCYGGSSYESAKNLFFKKDGGFVICGITESHDGDITSNHSYQYDNDIWVINIGEDGELISQKCFGGIHNEFVDFGVVKKSDYDYVIAATTDYGPSYDVQCDPMGNYPDEDYWVFEIKGSSIGISDQNISQSLLNVYPNPATDYLVFESEELVQSIHPELQIHDVYGNHVLSLNLNSQRTVCDTRSIPPGIYFYRTVIDGEVVSGKIIFKSSSNILIAFKPSGWQTLLIVCNYKFIKKNI